MEYTIEINRSSLNYLWVSYNAPICEECHEIMYFKCHGNARTLNIEGVEEQIIQCYYECRNLNCSNVNTLVAKHPEIVYKKLYSKSTFARVIYFKYIKKFSVKQILEEMPYLKQGTCYEIIRTYRAAARVSANERISEKFPPGTKICVAIDAMEPEKGQPALYTVREVSEGVLLGAKFLEDSSADAIHELLLETELKYGIIFVGFVSDKEKGIVAMHDRYYPGVPHQYCVVHFLDNVTKGLQKADKILQKEIRSDVRLINTLKTIKKKVRKKTSDLAEKERLVLAETRAALLAVVNQKKEDKFHLAGKLIYENLSKAFEWLKDFMDSYVFFQISLKFQLLLRHLVEKLQEILNKYRNQYDLVMIIDQYLHPIFAAVIDPHPKHPKRAFLDIIKIWENLVASNKFAEDVNGLIKKALKFAYSYERGLFIWRKTNLPKTNNGTEIFYHEKKGGYRRNSPNMKIGPTLYLTAPEEMYIPKDLTEDEILKALEVVGSLEYWQVRAEMRARSARRAFNRYCRKEIKGALKEIFKRLEVD